MAVFRPKMRAKIFTKQAKRFVFHVTKEEVIMQLSDKIKKFSVGQAIDYLNKNPVKNLPKLFN